MAILFDDGSSEYLEHAAAVVSSAPFSFAAWARCDAGGYHTIFCLGNAGVSNYWMMQLDGVTGGDPIQWKAYDGTSGLASTTGGYTQNIWHHLCVVEAASNNRAVYIDGSSKGTNATSVSPSVNRTAIGVRRVGGNLDSYMPGRIAEAAIWNVALTDAEVLKLANRAHPYSVRPASIVAYWAMKTIADLKDPLGGYDMTAYNAPVTAEHPLITYPSRQVVPHVAAAPAAGAAPERMKMGHGT